MARGCGQGRSLDMAWTKNVKHCVSLGDQIVGNDSPMTPPPQSLGAHDGAAATVAELAQFREAHPKILGHGVVGKVVEAVMLPKGVGLGCDTARLATQTAERAKVAIRDLDLSQRCWQSVLIVLWIGPGARDGAHIRDKLNVRLLQELDEFGDGARGMSDCEVGVHQLRI